jgi:hypothetical protein
MRPDKTRGSENGNHQCILISGYLKYRMVQSRVFVQQQLRTDVLDDL